MDAIHGIEIVAFFTVEIVKRNSDEFRTVRAFVEEHEGKSTRFRMVLLYSLQPGDPLEKKVLLNKQHHDREALYDLAYASLLDHFADHELRLYREGRKPFYFFKDSPRAVWMRSPFELTGTIRRKLFPLRKV